MIKGVKIICDLWWVFSIRLRPSINRGCVLSQRLFLCLSQNTVLKKFDLLFR